jgi:hypothetical protein
MHPFKASIEACVAAGLDFYVVVGADASTRIKMGLPQSVVDRQPLLLTLPAAYHAYSMPTADEVGLHCVLSFDTLYNCRIPWTSVLQVVLVQADSAEWPEAWDDEEARRKAQSLPKLAAVEEDETPPEPEPNNVREFRPRKRKE